MKINTKILIFFLPFLFFSFIFFNFIFLERIHAQTSMLGGLVETVDATKGALPKTSIKTEPQSIIADIISIVLSFIGIGFTVLIIYGGINWITAKGDSSKIDKARSIIIDGLIGLAIAVSAYAIAEFIIREIAAI